MVIHICIKTKEHEGQLSKNVIMQKESDLEQLLDIKSPE